MGDVVRFPQERCRWPQAYPEPAVVLMLPVAQFAELPRYDHLLMSEEAARAVRASFDAFFSVLNWPG